MGSTRLALARGRAPPPAKVRTSAARPASGRRRRYSTLCRSPAAERLDEKSLVTPPCGAGFDPLRLPSLVVFSFSLLGALRTRVARAFGWKKPSEGVGSQRPSLARRGSKEARREEGSAGARSGHGIKYTFGLGIALVSAFCAGVGIGLIAVTRF